MPSTNSIPPDANSNITLSTLVEALADDFEIGKTPEYHPTSGRVLKDSEDGTIYLADGTSWNDVSSAIGVDTPRTQTDHLYAKSRPTEAVIWKDSGGTIHADGETGELASDTELHNVLRTLVANEAPDLNILIKEDTYQLNDVVRVDKDRVRIVGEGWGTLIERYFEANSKSMLSFGDRPNEIEVNDCYLGHIAFDGRRVSLSNNGLQNVLVHSGANPTSFDDFDYFGKRNIIDTVKSINGPEENLVVDYGYNCSIINCHSENAKDAGIVMYKSWYGFLGNNYTEKESTAYNLNNSIYGTFVGNVAYDHFKEAIELKDAAGWPCKGNTLAGNRVKGSNVGNGIVLFGGSGKGVKDNALIGNVITGPSKGIQLEDANHNKIVGNVLQDMGIYGIEVDLDSNHNLIAHNHLLDPRNSNAAIIFSAASSPFADHNLVIGNIIDTTTGTEWKHGVKISAGGEFNEFTNNHITSASTSPYSDAGTKTKINGVIQSTYTGDGTTGRDIDLQFKPKQIIVKDGAGNIYDWIEGLGNGIIGSSPSGTLEASDTRAIRVGDNGADADPNTNAETYTYWAR